ncbi:MAG: hypothetical protein IR153_06345 [Flavobacterium sp.]|nr:hypothetical protein [Flavobacterium sp.]
MTSFKTRNHIEIDHNYQGINLTEFALVYDDQTGNDQIIETFIRTKNFSYDSLRDSIKENPNKGYLRRAFDIDKIKISDFKKTDRESTLKFLIDFLNEPDWGDDRNEFAKLLERYLEYYNKFEDNSFYILSKDWFDKKDERLIEPESWCYTYYFLIISIDRNSRILNFSEWTYD